MLIGLLEDDLAIQEMLKLLLDSAGHEVAAYASTEECLADLRVTDHAGGLSSPDLLFVDLRLAKAASGTAVIELIRANPRLYALPIILMTASAFPDKRELERLHVKLLLKPFDIDDVVQLVDELTGHLS